MLLAIIGRVQGVHHALELVSGFGGGDADGAGNGVLAEQYALRPLENFHSLQVHGGRHSRQCPAPGIHAVDEHAHGLLETGVGAGAHAADEQVRRTGTIVDGDVGNVAGQFFQVDDGEIVNFFTADGNNRDGYVLQVFGPLLGGDDNFFQLHLLSLSHGTTAK